MNAWGIVNRANSKSMGVQKWRDKLQSYKPKYEKLNVSFFIQIARESNIRFNKVESHYRAIC